MDDWTSALFDRMVSLTMAFLVPGLVALFAVATVSPTVLAWFSGASNGPTLAGFFFVVLGAFALGLVITAIRFCLFEATPIPFANRCLVKASPQLDESKRKEFAAEYNDLRQKHYDHYLAYSNLSVAIPIGVAIWKAGSVPAPTWVLFSTVLTISVVSTLALAAAGCDAVRRYDDRRTRLLGLVRPAA
jgi:hypothetical protein